MQFVNLLNQTIVLEKSDGTTQELPAYTGEQILIIIDNTDDPVNNTPILVKSMNTTPLPDPQDGILYIVPPGMGLMAGATRSDILTPVFKINPNGARTNPDGSRTVTHLMRYRFS